MFNEQMASCHPIRNERYPSYVSACNVALLKLQSLEGLREDLRQASNHELCLHLNDHEAGCLRGKPEVVKTSKTVANDVGKVDTETNYRWHPDEITLGQSGILSVRRRIGKSTKYSMKTICGARTMKMVRRQGYQC
jgi:hypothetical protein